MPPREGCAPCSHLPDNDNQMIKGVLMLLMTNGSGVVLFSSNALVPCVTVKTQTTSVPTHCHALQAINPPF